MRFGSSDAPIGETLSADCLQVVGVVTRLALMPVSRRFGRRRQSVSSVGVATSSVLDPSNDEQ